MSWRDRRAPLQIAKGVSWSVLTLVAGLFVIVEALQGAGGLRLAVAGPHEVQSMGGVLSNLVTAFSVALLSNRMNNLPVGLISGNAVHSLPGPENLANAVLICVDLGPQPFRYRLARHDFMAHRATAGECEDHRLGVFQDGPPCNADRFAGKRYGIESSLALLRLYARWRDTVTLIGIDEKQAKKRWKNR